MTTVSDSVTQMKARLLDRHGLEKLATRKAEEIREYGRAHHEDQCSGVKLDTRLGTGGRRWFRCTGCLYVFNEFTEGAAALVRKAGA